MIAVDAMGGDRAPQAIVQGAITAAQSGIPILLCGDQDQLASLLTSYAPSWQSLPIEIQHAPQVIAMEDEPTKAVKKKSESSLVQAMKAVRSGRATAFVSAGNSGAVLIASILFIGRMPGILRPAIGGFIPTRKKSIFCLDLGANVDCKAAYLYQFALLGHAYVRLIRGIEKPRVALLSNGHEPYKGSAEIKKVFDYLSKSSLHFVGNLEPRDMFHDHADILVCDGFAGNVMLKSIQGAAHALFTWIKDESTQSSWFKQVMLWGNKPLFERIKSKMDYATTGGALLLGVQHPVVLAHGRSDARAITNAIRFAQQVVDNNYVPILQEELKPLLKHHISFAGAMKQKVQSILHWGQS